MRDGGYRPPAASVAIRYPNTDTAAAPTSPLTSTGNVPLHSDEQRTYAEPDTLQAVARSHESLWLAASASLTGEHWR
jgi:hypothetical protein